MKRDTPPAHKCRFRVVQRQKRSERKSATADDEVGRVSAAFIIDHFTFFVSEVVRIEVGCPNTRAS